MKPGQCVTSCTCGLVALGTECGGAYSQRLLQELHCLAGQFWFVSHAQVKWFGEYVIMCYYADRCFFCVDVQQTAGECSVGSDHCRLQQLSAVCQVLSAVNPVLELYVSHILEMLNMMLYLSLWGWCIVTLNWWTVSIGTSSCSCLRQGNSTSTCHKWIKDKSSKVGIANKQSRNQN